MAKYKLSNIAKEDLIRIHHYGVKTFGIAQADKYFDDFFIDFIKIGYRRCVYGSDSIYFRVNNNIVEIMTIIGRQDLTMPIS